MKISKNLESENHGNHGNCTDAATQEISVADSLMCDRITLYKYINDLVKNEMASYAFLIQHITLKGTPCKCN